MKRLLTFAPAIGIFCLALLVRVVYNNTVAYSYYPLHDSLFYQTIGFNVIKEHCFCLHPYITTVYRAPLWPWIIAAISLVIGPGDYYARLFLCCIGSGTCVLIYLFAKDLFGRWIALLAGIFAAIYPELYIYDGWLYTESLYTFLLLAFCYGVYSLLRTRWMSDQVRDKSSLYDIRLQRSSLRSRWIWCGVLLGLLSLTRPNGLFMLGLFIFWVGIMGWIKVLAWRDAAKGIAVVSLIGLGIIAPWTIRNYNVSHTFIPVATGDGTVLLGAYNDKILTAQGYLGLWIDPLKSRPDVAKPFPLSTCDAPCEVAREDAYRHAAILWIQGHLGIMPQLLEMHLLNMWQPDTHEADLPTDRFPHQPSSQLVLSMMKTFPIPVFVLAALGLVATLRKWRELLLIYLVILMTIGECLVFYGSPRFRAPIEPMLILLAVGAVWWLTHREKGTLWWLVGRLRGKDESRAEKPGKTEYTPV